MPDIDLTDVSAIKSIALAAPLQNPMEPIEASFEIESASLSFA